MKKWILFGVIVMTLAGCASIKQAHSDVQTGLTAPSQSPTEILPQAVGQNVQNVVAAAPLPFANTAAPLIGGLATILAAWFRGRQIRKNQPLSANPITGTLGDTTAVEGIVQNLATVSQGITEVFSEGSTAQHVWQGAITSLLGLGGVALAVPSVQSTIIVHPEIAAYVAGLSGLFNGFQQSLTKVLPVASASTLTIKPSA